MILGFSTGLIGSNLYMVFEDLNLNGGRHRALFVVYFCVSYTTQPSRQRGLCIFIGDYFWTDLFMTDMILFHVLTGEHTARILKQRLEFL